MTRTDFVPTHSSKSTIMYHYHNISFSRVAEGKSASDAYRLQPWEE